MVTTTKPQHADREPAAPDADDALVRALEKAPGWDPERQALVHGKGERPRDLVNDAAARRARRSSNQG